MSGSTENADVLAAINQSIKAINDLCGCLTVTMTANIAVGVTIEQTEGTEGGTPPAGAGEPDPISDRKCKAAEILYDDVEAILTNLDDNPLTVSFFDMATIDIVLVSYLSDGTLIIGSLLQGIWGWIIDIASFFIAFSGMDYADMLADWQLNKEAIICDMYNSVSPADLRAMLRARLTLTSSEEAFIVDLLFPNDVANVLFFSVGGSEAIISSYTPSESCVSCCPIYTVTRGTEVDEDTWDSENTGEGTWPFHHRVSIAFGCTGDEADCGGPKRYITINSAPGYTQTQGADLGVRMDSEACYPASVPDPDIYEDDIMPTGQTFCVKGLVICSETAFTLNMTIGEAC